MTQSQNLTDFYGDYLHWATEIKEDRKPFYMAEGLCFAIHVWCIEMDCRPQVAPMLKEMDMQFQRAGLVNDGNPFNQKDAGDTPFWMEVRDHTCHLNPKRLKWVKDHVSIEGA